ncbi:MAG: tyrosine-type recombinase/integrase [Phycisphaerales bacterium]|nr:MAG: tyrosine-type recombinase/integrase [Phycisphaerales bacterium]
MSRLLQYVNTTADHARRRGTTRAIVDEFIVLLMLNTGIKAGELCRLNIADLPTDHTRNLINLRDARGNIARTIDAPQMLIDYLRQFIATYRHPANPNEPLIISERGRRLIYMSLYSKLKKIGRKAGIGKLHPQMLRATYAVRLYDQVKDLRLVQRRLGHAGHRTTAIYVTPGGEPPRRAEPDSPKLSRRQSKNSPKAAHHASTTKKTDGPAKPPSTACPPTFTTCEACGASVRVGAATRIDSGQILCIRCISEIRTHHRRGG